MKNKDPALTISNPRLISAIYFGLLSVVGTILIDAFLNALGVEEIVPVFQAVILGMVVATCFGAIFGESIIHGPKPYKSRTFWLGFIMVIASIPIFDLGLLLLMKEDSSGIFATAKLPHMFYIYLIILAYSYVLFGILLAIAAGLAAMYLRGQLVYDILHSHELRRRKPKKLVEPDKSAQPHKVHTHR